MTGSPHNGQPPTGAPQCPQNRCPSPRDAPHRAHLSTRYLYPPARPPVHGPHSPQQQSAPGHTGSGTDHSRPHAALRTPRTSAYGHQEPIDQLPGYPPGIGRAEWGSRHTAGCSLSVIVQVLNGAAAADVTGDGSDPGLRHRIRAGRPVQARSPHRGRGPGASCTDGLRSRAAKRRGSPAFSPLPHT